MAQIPINVEASCGQHPRLKPGYDLPRNGQTRISQERLFSLGSLSLQNDKKIEFESYDETRHRWTALLALYGAYLTFEPQQVTTDAEGETLTKLSEIVGVALGMAAMCAQFEVNLNRFRKFMTPGSSTRRVDFEYYSGSQRFFHETKGTTYDPKVQGMCDDIGEQKEQTQDYVANYQVSPGAPAPLAISGCTGSVALYRHVLRTNFLSLITLIDPPTADTKGARPPSESDELACVLRYYQNFYAVTHPTIQNDRSLGIGQWLAQVADGLEHGRPAPDSAPANLRARARVTEPGATDSLYRGSYIDARLVKWNVIASPTFEVATERIRFPVTFLGVSQEVTALIQGCRWEDLLAYNDAGVALDRDGIDVSESGIMSKRVDPEEVNEESRRSFASLKRLWRPK